MTAPALLATGDLVAGKYRVERLLGQGGMGAVYAAENVDIGRRVAIKILHPDCAGDANVLARFRNEARAAAAIGHPGIVDVLDLGHTDAGGFFIVMERLDGETLGERIRRAPLAVVEAVRVVERMLEALQAAHDKGIVHRDLKPENVFLVGRGDSPVAVKLLDFGISKFAGDGDVALTQTGVVMGTPLYMSPEQARGAREAGPASDLYSTGAILYEALAGRAPFGGRSYNEVIAKVLMDPHEPLVKLRPEVGAALSSVVDALLAKAPAQRPPTARAAREALARALDPSLAGRPVDEAGAIGVASTMAATPLPRPPAPPPLLTAEEALARTTPKPSLAPGGGATLSPSPATTAIGPHRDPEALLDTDASEPEQRERSLLVAAALLLLGIFAAAGVVVALGHRAASSARSPAAPTSPSPHAPAAATARSVTPAAPSTPAAAAPPTSVRITIAAEPRTARWTLDGKPLDCNPCDLDRAPGERHVAVAHAPGFGDARLDLVFDHARGEHVVLAAAPSTPAHHRSPVGPGTGAAPSTKRAPGGPVAIDPDNPF